MELKRINYKLTVCKVSEVTSFNKDSDFYFIGKTDEELSLVCKTEDTPRNTIERDDGWRSFRIQGVLDFSLIGILSRLSSYILVKEENFERALEVLATEGYTVV